MCTKLVSQARPASVLTWPARLAQNTPLCNLLGNSDVIHVIKWAKPSPSVLLTVSD